MYDLPYYKEKDPQVIKAFIDQHPFAFLAGCDAAGKPVATQVPIFIEEEHGKKILRGHIMRNTDHHKAFEHNNNVLAIFTGPHTYVSATWYSNPSQASTWNYMSVHVKGKIRFLDEGALEDVLRKTSLHFENYNHQSTTIFDNLPGDYTSKLMKSIIAFEIEVNSIENVFKLSQNRDEESFHHIMDKLSVQDEDGKQIAEEMKKRKDQLYPQ